MSYEDYRKEVFKLIDRWIDALFTGGTKSQTDSFKEIAEDMINGWKDSFPQRKAEISKIVSNYLASRFDSQM